MGGIDVINAIKDKFGIKRLNRRDLEIKGIKKLRLEKRKPKELVATIGLSKTTLDRLPREWHGYGFGNAVKMKQENGVITTLVTAKGIPASFMYRSGR